MKIFKFISLPILLSLNSCFFILDSGYKGLATTTLAGFTVFSQTACFMSTTEPETVGTDVILNVVINLVTVGDKYVTACVVTTNYERDFTPQTWFNKDQISINFYASSNVADPASVGDSSEVLIYGTTPSGEFKDTFFFNELYTGAGVANVLCSEYLGDTSIDGIFLADLELINLDKKPYIVARMPLCGNLALGTASNPLYSEKNYIDPKKQ